MGVGEGVVGVGVSTRSGKRHSVFRVVTMTEQGKGALFQTTW